MRAHLLTAACWLWLCACGAAGSHRASQPQTAGAPGEIRYETGTPESNEPQTQLSRDVAQALRDIRPPVAHDPRLDRVAARLLESGRIQAPSLDVLDDLMRAQGLVEPLPRVTAAEAEREDTLVQSLTSRVRDRVDAGLPITHYGLAIRTTPSGERLAILLLASRLVELEPLPRSVPAGSHLALRGRVLGDYRDPRWVVSPPEGSVQRLPSTGRGPGFALDVPLAERGEYRVELLANGPLGDAVLANFPVWAGESAPAVQLHARQGPRTHQDARAVTRKLRALIASERKRHGLPPLKETRSLDAIALAHSQDMARHGFIGHRSPRTGGPADRVRAAGLSAWLVRENLGLGYSAEEIHEGLMRSPGHRDNVLSPDAESLGLGVVAKTEGGDDGFLATQLFVSLAHPVDPRKARRSLLEQIDRARQKAGLRAVETDDSLMRSAQAAAERFFRDSVDRQTLLAETLRETQAPAELRVGATLTVVQSLAQLERSPLGLEPETRRIGVGVAQGQRPDTGPNTLAVVVLSGQH